MCVNVKYINLPNWWFSPHKSSRKSQAATNTLKKKYRNYKQETAICFKTHDQL